MTNQTSIQQQNRINMAIEPKSDQQNYDDFLTGTKTITITGVKSTGNANDQQPVSVGYQGDNGRPFMPCKSMRRVMVRVWGSDAAEYVGKSMTLFGDPDVIFAGKKVGGIRISHMSHIDDVIMVPISTSKTKRILYKVEPLKVDMVDTEEDDYPELYKRAQGQASQGIAAYQDFYMSLNGDDKARLNENNDHDAFKKMASEMDSINSSQENNLSNN